MGNCLIEFLNSVETQGLNYVSWKNNHELGLCLDGTSDLDIFVPISQREAFLELAKRKAWLEVVNPVSKIADVTHFYKSNQPDKYFHLHVYFKIISGESWLKEYQFPLEEYFLKNNHLDTDYRIRVLRQTSTFIFVLRHLVKNSSISSRHLPES